MYKCSSEITSSGSNSDTGIKLLTPPLGISAAVIYLTTPGNIYKAKKISQCRACTVQLSLSITSSLNCSSGWTYSFATKDYLIGRRLHKTEPNEKWNVPFLWRLQYARGLCPVICRGQIIYASKESKATFKRTMLRVVGQQCCKCLLIAKHLIGFKLCATAPDTMQQLQGIQTDTTSTMLGVVVQQFCVRLHAAEVDLSSSRLIY